MFAVIRCRIVVEISRVEHCVLIVIRIDQQLIRIERRAVFFVEQQRIERCERIACSACLITYVIALYASSCYVYAYVKALFVYRFSVFVNVLVNGNLYYFVGKLRIIESAVYRHIRKYLRVIPNYVQSLRFLSRIVRFEQYVHLRRQAVIREVRLGIEHNSGNRLVSTVFGESYKRFDNEVLQSVKSRGFVVFVKQHIVFAVNTVIPCSFVGIHVDYIQQLRSADIYRQIEFLSQRILSEIAGNDILSAARRVNHVIER